MARHKKENVTRAKILKVGTERFLSGGYSATTAKSIADELGISTGHLTFYYPTKVHLLAELVQMLCSFQWKLMQRLLEEGESELAAMSLELMAMAAMCEENEIARDFYINAYTQPMTLEIIRRSDIQRAKSVYAPYCVGWTEDMFAGAEVLVSGIEYATLAATESSPPMDIRLKGAMEQIFSIYQVPEETRRRVIREVLLRDYRRAGRQILSEFTGYIKEVNEQTLEGLLSPP